MENPQLIATGILQFFVLILSLTVHEFAHAAAAFRLGDDTASLQGRMTLNPLAHLDPVGSVLFPLLMIFGNVPLIGWARPVPTNPLRLRGYRRGQALVAAAGPASNLVLAVLCLLGYALYARAVGSLLGRDIVAVRLFLLYGVYINAALAVFNLIPLPPLDGSWILSWRLRGRGAEFYERYVEPYGFLILLACVFTGLLGILLAPVYAALFLLIQLVS